MPNPTRRDALRITAGAAVALPMMATTAVAATHTVTIQNFAFNPANLTISAGDTVTWINADSTQHSALDLGGAFDTNLINPGASASLTFNGRGTFNYRCGPHQNMRGSITIT
ncbi:Plastocyanin [Cognatiyoonia koreensis]|uniref:Plastocyanin n=1 Tax=Cognatiyoonia koreensis TaxID=364200 RepID=A0A1I0PMQ3_9RHOB|nr:cupredoxin family copper-binding protein [Cognatiyoonia koreensis]SEW15642.1 Plastocyanin [Cognatiyoonia koreensis]